MGWQSAIGAVLDIILPAHCVTCPAPVAVAGQFCAACFNQTVFVTDPCCGRCGVGFASAAFGGAGLGGAGSGGADLTCTECRDAPPPWSSARAALRYDDRAAAVILPLKYGDRLENALALAPHLARAGSALLAAADWVVPVPLHRRRLLVRRYNQSAALARAVTRLVPRPLLLDALIRIRSTASLGVLPPAMRRAELAGAIAVRDSRRDALRDSRVLLIDDVLTTGATAAACTEALLAAGVIRVDVLAAARAIPREP